MSVRPMMRWAMAALMWVPLSALAIGIPDLLPDPLFTQPDRLDSGATLPGDGEPVVCPAAADVQHSIALSEAVDLALCNNPQVKAAWAAIKVQSAAVGEARGAYLPTLTGSATRQTTKNHFPNFPTADTKTTGHTRYASLSWRLFDFGGRAANREAANQMLVAALAGHDAALQKTLSSVVGAYFDAVTAQATVAARGKAVRYAEDTLTATRRREDKGAAARSDTLQASTALAKERLTEQRARGDYRKAQAVLGYAMGLAPDKLPEPMSQPEDAKEHLAEDLAQWLADAKEQHPAIVAARAQWAAAKAKVTTARSEGLPTLDFSGNYYQNGYPNQGIQTNKSNVTTVGVTLTIPLFEGFTRTYKIRGAEAQAEQSEAQLQDTEHQVLSEVVKAYADTESALANLSSSQTLLESAEAAMASAERRYAKGAADVLELLNAQTALADAQQERIRCLAEWHSARLRLLANAGMLGRGRL